ncbi:MAG: molybdopterin cofactor-binding domain-containing protein, partial [Flavobacteriaceae bacterium]
MNKENKGISRRRFIVRTALGGTAVILGTTYLARNPIRRKIAEMVNTAESPYLGNTDDPTIWFEVRVDNTMLFHCPKVEMGQGTFTGLAQIAADELDVDLGMMTVVHAASASGNIDSFGTGGSTSISSLWEPLRELAATMREMIKLEAAKKLGTDPALLTTAAGIISAKGKTMTYGEAVQGVTEWKVPKTPPLKAIKDYKFIGKPLPRVDLKDKVLGVP